MFAPVSGDEHLAFRVFHDRQAYEFLFNSPDHVKGLLSIATLAEETHFIMHGDDGADAEVQAAHFFQIDHEIEALVLRYGQTTETHLCAYRRFCIELLTHHDFDFDTRCMCTRGVAHHMVRTLNLPALPSGHDLLGRYCAPIKSGWTHAAMAVLYDVIPHNIVLEFPQDVDQGEADGNGES